MAQVFWASLVTCQTLDCESRVVLSTTGSSCVNGFEWARRRVWPGRPHSVNCGPVTAPGPGRLSPGHCLCTSRSKRLWQPRVSVTKLPESARLLAVARARPLAGCPSPRRRVPLSEAPGRLAARPGPPNPPLRCGPCATQAASVHPARPGTELVPVRSPGPP
jgi:hypothetical protein